MRGGGRKRQAQGAACGLVKRSEGGCGLRAGTRPARHAPIGGQQPVDADAGAVGRRAHGEAVVGGVLAVHAAEAEHGEALQHMAKTPRSNALASTHKVVAAAGAFANLSSQSSISVCETGSPASTRNHLKRALCPAAMIHPPPLHLVVVIVLQDGPNAHDGLLVLGGASCRGAREGQGRRQTLRHISMRSIAGRIGAHIFLASLSPTRLRTQQELVGRMDSKPCNMLMLTTGVRPQNEQAGSALEGHEEGRAQTCW